MTERPASPKKSLELRQTWFLVVTALAVVLMFAFVILPYVDKKPGKLSGQVMEDFNLELLSGGDAGDRVALSDLRGKTVVLDFWASWCRPCRLQSKALAELSGKVGDDVYILGIATADKNDAAQAFLAEEKPPYANAFDEGGAVAGALQINDLPTIVMLDKDGVIRVSQGKVFTTNELFELVDSVKAQ